MKLLALLAPLPLLCLLLFGCGEGRLAEEYREGLVIEQDLDRTEEQDQQNATRPQ
jgi:hypothetical protein